MPEQFSEKKRQAGSKDKKEPLCQKYSVPENTGEVGGQKTRLESELLSAKKRHKGSQRARGLVATLASKLALRHLT